MTTDLNIDLPKEAGIYKIYRRDKKTGERIYVGTAEVEFKPVASNKKPTL